MKYSILTSALFISLTFSNTASAQNYYNCANASGCELIATKKSRSNYAATQYPVVLSHGLAGWSRLFGLVDYFYDMPQTLMKAGADVFATKVTAVNDTEMRGEMLLKQVKTIAAVSGKDKVNLIGHSLGGIDIRYVAAVAPEHVASVTALASPEQGSAMADWTVKMIKEGSAEEGLPEGEYNNASKITFAVLNFLGGVIDFGSGIAFKDLPESDTFRAAKGLTSDYMSAYNKKHPQAMPTEYCGQPPEDYIVNGIPYYSYTGVGQVTNIFDPIDYALALTALPFEGEPNDGLVSACSARLGYVIREDYKMNHLDIVNQLLGITSWGEANPTTVLRSQINRLKEKEGK